MMPYFQNYIPTDISCYRSQQMASIALSVVGCIDYLAYGAIFTRAVFPFVVKEAKKLSFLIPAKKAQDVRREEVGRLISGFSGGKKKSRTRILTTTSSENHLTSINRNTAMSA